MMWVLVMIVMYGVSGVSTNHLYFEDEMSCKKAQVQFESHKNKDVKLKAICLRGDNG